MKKHIGLLGILAFWTLFLLPKAGQAQVTLDIDPQIDQTKVDFDLWNRIAVPVHDRLTLPFTGYDGTLRIMWGNRALGGCGQIIIPSYPQNKSDVGDGFYRMLTHEYGHAKDLCNEVRQLPMRLLDFDVEGIAEAAKNLTYRELARTIPGIKKSTELFSGDVRDNMPVTVIAGEQTYRANRYFYESLTAKLELFANVLPGKNFVAYYQALTELRPQNKQEYFAMLDLASGGRKIDGMSPSTFFQKSSASFLNGPDGMFFALWVHGKVVNTEKWLGTLDMPVNPQGIQTMVRVRENGIQKPVTTYFRFKWEVADAFGRTMTSGSHYTSGFGGDSLQVNGWPNGAYRLTGCILQADSSCDPALYDTAYFAVYNGAWENGKIFVFANAPEFTDLKSQTQLRLAHASSGVSTETYPGLLVLNLNGSTDDVAVSDGRRTRTFTPDHEASRFVPFTDRDQPYAYSAVNGASFLPGPLVPGSIAVVFTWGACQNDPQQSLTLPLPFSSCAGEQGQTKVVFTAGGTRFEAPIFYCARSQCNVQIPRGLAGHSSVQVQVVLNNTASNAITMRVGEAFPGIFVADWQTLTGAVTFPDGQLADAQHPAQTGDTLSVFATGLGAVYPETPADGMPAPVSPVPLTLNTPIVTLDGVICPISFSGLAPGSVGLYQVNFTVPEGLAPGKHELVLSITNSTSNTVNLITR